MKVQILTYFEDGQLTLQCRIQTLGLLITFDQALQTVVHEHNSSGFRKERISAKISSGRKRAMFMALVHQAKHQIDSNSTKTFPKYLQKKSQDHLCIQGHVEVHGDR